MKVLFHTHTNNSKCSNLSSERLVRYCVENNIKSVFVTDHNIITKLNSPEIDFVPGVEISTAQGDLIGIFIDQVAPKGQSIKETAAYVHSKGGLVVAPHPGDFFRREAMSLAVYEKNIEHFDIVEANNSRNLLYMNKKRVIDLAQKNHKVLVYGADAHYEEELGNSCIEMPVFKNKSEFISNLQAAEFTHRKSGLKPHLKSIAKKYFKRNVK